MNQTKADKLYKKHKKLIGERDVLQKEYKKVNKVIAEYRKLLKAKNLEIKTVCEAIYSMKHGGETPSVSDHAIVRYLERYKGLDIYAIKDEISHHNNKVMVDNLIVTVNMDLEDEKSD